MIYWRTIVRLNLLNKRFIMKSKEKEIKDVRLTFRMTSEEAKRFEETAKRLECKQSYLARLAVGAVVQASDERLASV